jgi:hypothetical protein
MKIGLPGIEQQASSLKPILAYINNIPNDLCISSQ